MRFFIRIATTTFFIFLAVILPWWVALVGATVVAFIFPRYFEIVVIGLLLDILYAQPLPFFGDFQFIMTTFALIALLCVGVIKYFLKTRTTVYGLS